VTVSLLPALTDEQAMLVDASVRFMDVEVPMSVVRARADGTEPDADRYRRTAAELGWLGLLADDARGGGSASGNGVLDAALLAAERGARLQPGPFAGHAVVVDALSTAGTHDAALAEMIGGEAWATWAFDPEGSCRLISSGDALRLDGTVAVVAEAALCGWLLATATGPDGPTQVLVRADAPGVGLHPLEGLDVSRSWARLELDGVGVAPVDLVGTPGAATQAAVAGQSQLAAVLTAAESVGAMHTDFHMALQYAKDRVAFGRPIGSFQALKHILADMSLSLEMSAGLVAAAATALGSGAADGPELAHAAKAFVAEHGIELAHNSFQVFGGIGYTWEHDQHLFLRRLAADAECFGSPAWHRTRLLETAEVA
jgi:alkylation response protein AidB-like acyl-CoA dehydrogenase